MTLVTEDDGDELVEALNKDGLLSPVIDDWRVHYLEQYKDWFGFCRRLNQSVMKVWIDHWRKGQGGSSAALIPTAGRVFGRGINNFAAAVILCERGMAIEAANLARSITEASFWLGYMVEAPEKALSDLEADDLKNQIDRERELRRVFADDIGAVEESKLRQAEFEVKLGGRKAPPIFHIGKSFGASGAYLNYRILSGYYGHLSYTSLRHNFLTTGEKVGMNMLGPHANEIPKALYFAANSLVDCGAAYAVIVDDQPAAVAFAEFGAEVVALRDGN